MADVNEGDIVKAIGNHCYKGWDGVVVQVETVEGVDYVHASLNGTGEKIIMRSGQYKIVKRRIGEPKPLRNVLLEEVMPHIRRIANNSRYSSEVREAVLSEVSSQCEDMIEALAVGTKKHSEAQK